MAGKTVSIVLKPKQIRTFIIEVKTGMQKRGKGRGGKKGREEGGEVEERGEARKRGEGY